MVDKIKKIGKIGFPMECFTADFSQFSIAYLKNNHKLRNEKGYDFLSLKENQWKLR